MAVLELLVPVVVAVGEAGRYSSVVSESQLPVMLQGPALKRVIGLAEVEEVVGVRVSQEGVSD